MFREAEIRRLVKNISPFAQSLETMGETLRQPELPIVVGREHNASSLATGLERLRRLRAVLP